MKKWENNSDLCFDSFIAFYQCVLNALVNESIYVVIVFFSIFLLKLFCPTTTPAVAVVTTITKIEHHQRQLWIPHRCNQWRFQTLIKGGAMGILPYPVFTPKSLIIKWLLVATTGTQKYQRGGLKLPNTPPLYLPLIVTPHLLQFPFQPLEVLGTSLASTFSWASLLTAGADLTWGHLLTCLHQPPRLPG